MKTYSKMVGILTIVICWSVAKWPWITKFVENCIQAAQDMHWIVQNVFM